MQATAVKAQPVRLFLDTEFATIKEAPRLLSIALISEAGQFIYMEVAQDDLRSIPSRRLTKFLKEHVLPQFGRIADSAVAVKDMPRHLFDWLHSLNADEVEVVYDYSSDYLLLEQLLAAMAEPPTVHFTPVHFGYALADPDGQAEAELTWERTEVGFGIRRHHALADAMALGARYRAIHCKRYPGLRDMYPVGPHEKRVHDVEAVVTILVPEFEFVRAETAHGDTLSIGKRASGVSWTHLQVGQQLLCTVEFRSASTRVLRVQVVDPDGDSAA